MKFFLILLLLSNISFGNEYPNNSDDSLSLDKNSPNLIDNYKEIQNYFNSDSFEENRFDPESYSHLFPETNEDNTQYICVVPARKNVTGPAYRHFTGKAPMPFGVVALAYALRACVNNNKGRVCNCRPDQALCQPYSIAMTWADIFQEVGENQVGQTLGNAAKKCKK